MRLGWTVVPRTLACETANRALHRLWFRRQTTMFNGASNIVQEGRLAALSETGQRECQAIIDYYMTNAKVIREASKASASRCSAA